MHHNLHPRLAALTLGINLTGSLPADMLVFLQHHDHLNTANHCLRVALEARRLAERFGAPADLAESAAWLHDISAVIPTAQRLQAARELGLETLPEEERHPMLLHQRLSAVMAKEIFGMCDPAVLQAIACHTTLRQDASALDKVVFVADKLAWDGVGNPPYLEAMRVALEYSLDDAALCYLELIWQQRATLGALHPWALQAYEQLRRRLRA
ncbi:MAG: bis(5'-nucleosyl)-tetraphosphatase (symmetrical) YqeK [Anaerolineales bacterium]|nr:bis(5'-nucleosyl)-tetraphosphatase (symmetrical) YqeK [Anaerolineales bacterium]